MSGFDRIRSVADSGDTPKIIGLVILMVALYVGVICGVALLFQWSAPIALFILAVTFVRLAFWVFS